MAKRSKIRGARKLEAKLDDLPAEIRNAARRAVSKSAAAVQTDARGAVPVDTGALRAGILTVDTDGGLGAQVGVFDPDLYYAQFVEHGTSDTPARPFLLPAAEAERARLPRRIQAEVVRLR